MFAGIDSPVFLFFLFVKTKKLGIGCSKVSVISTPANEVILGTEWCLVESNSNRVSLLKFSYNFFSNID